jgi:hypothetical protein
MSPHMNVCWRRQTRQQLSQGYSIGRRMSNIKTYKTDIDSVLVLLNGKEQSSGPIGRYQFSIGSSQINIGRRYTGGTILCVIHNYKQET